MLSQQLSFKSSSSIPNLAQSGYAAMLMCKLSRTRACYQPALNSVDCFLKQNGNYERSSGRCDRESQAVLFLSQIRANAFVFKATCDIIEDAKCEKLKGVHFLFCAWWIFNHTLPLAAAQLSWKVQKLKFIIRLRIFTRKRSISSGLWGPHHSIAFTASGWPSWHLSCDAHPCRYLIR